MTNTINEVWRRKLDNGEPLTAEDEDTIIADMRRQRKLYEGGGKPESTTDKVVDEGMKFLESVMPKKPMLKRRL